MFHRTAKFIRSFLTVSVPDNHRTEFITGINRINIARAKMTAIAFIFMEAIMLAVSWIIKRDGVFTKPGIYYLIMYVFLLLAMVLFLFLFVKLGKNISENETGLLAAGIAFSGVILLWCAGISLMDQLSSGQIIIYIAAILSIAIAPLFEPAVLMLLYLAVQILFLVLLPYFHKSAGLPFGNMINSTTIMIIAWVISCMRYNKQVEDFKNKKTIQEKNDELKRINRQLAQTNRKLEKLSRTDSLTGVYNRLVFDRIIKAEWERCKRHSSPLSLLMVDIDFFKRFNDNYGHQAGDDCIRQVAGILLICAKRLTNIVARYGGEEFAIILPYTDQENTIKLAEHMREMVEKLAIPHAYSSAFKYVTISMGAYTVIPTDKSSLEEFIKIADKALYKAKKHRNNIVIA